MPIMGDWDGEDLAGDEAERPSPMITGCGGFRKVFSSIAEPAVHGSAGSIPLAVAVVLAFFVVIRLMAVSCPVDLRAALRLAALAPDDAGAVVIREPGFVGRSFLQRGIAAAVG